RNVGESLDALTESARIDVHLESHTPQIVEDRIVLRRLTRQVRQEAESIGPRGLLRARNARPGEHRRDAGDERAPVDHPGSDLIVAAISRAVAAPRSAKSRQSPA